MEGFLPKKIEANLATSVVVPNGSNSVEIMGEERFNRLQKLGAILASGKVLNQKSLYRWMKYLI